MKQKVIDLAKQQQINTDLLEQKPNKILILALKRSLPHFLLKPWVDSKVIDNKKIYFWQLENIPEKIDEKDFKLVILLSRISHPFDQQERELLAKFLHHTVFVKIVYFVLTGETVGFLEQRELAETTQYKLQQLGFTKPRQIASIFLKSEKKYNIKNWFYTPFFKKTARNEQIRSILITIAEQGVKQAKAQDISLSEQEGMVLLKQFHHYFNQLKKNITQSALEQEDLSQDSLIEIIQQQIEQWKNNQSAEHIWLNYLEKIYSNIHNTFIEQLFIALENNLSYGIEKTTIKTQEDQEENLSNIMINIFYKVLFILFSSVIMAGLISLSELGKYNFLVVIGSIIGLIIGFFLSNLIFKNINKRVLVEEKIVLQGFDTAETKLLLWLKNYTGLEAAIAVLEWENILKELHNEVL